MVYAVVFSHNNRPHSTQIELNKNEYELTQDDDSSQENGTCCKFAFTQHQQQRIVS